MDIDVLRSAAQLKPLLEGARLDHISMVVKDRERAIAGLSTLVQGPFDRFEYTNTALVFGVHSTYTLHMALAPLSPTLDLEIIELYEGKNAIHEQFLLQHGEGLQHLAYEVQDFEITIAKFVAAGFHPILEKEGGTPVAIYMDIRSIGGFFVELIRKGFRMRDPSTWPG